MSFFSLLLDDARKAMAVAQPIITIAENIAPVVAGAFPATAPVINAIEAGAASITAIAPSVVASTTNMIAEGEAIIAAATPEIQRLEALFAALFHRTAAPQATVLTPAASAASVPAKAA